MIPLRAREQECAGNEGEGAHQEYLTRFIEYEDHLHERGVGQASVGFSAPSARVQANVQSVRRASASGESIDRDSCHHRSIPSSKAVFSLTTARSLTGIGPARLRPRTLLDPRSTGGGGGGGEGTLHDARVGVRAVKGGRQVSRGGRREIGVGRRCRHGGGRDGRRRRLLGVV